MATHFVYRSPYFHNHKFYKEQPEQNILEWFQAFWKLKQGNYDLYDSIIEEKIGTRVYGIHDYLLENIYEGAVKMPVNLTELLGCLREYSYVNEIIINDEHLIQIHTDDDELDMVYYIFDDTFVERNPDKALFLCNDLKDLLTNVKNGETKVPNLPQIPFRVKSSEGEEAIYFLFFSSWGENSIGLLNEQGNSVGCLQGVNFDNLTLFLNEWQPTKNTPEELLLIRSKVRNNNKINTLEETLVSLNELVIPSLLWNKRFDKHNLYNESVDDVQAYLENIMTHLSKDDTRLPAQIYISTHFVEMIYNASRTGDEGVFDYWLMFDEAWADQNPSLAINLIKFAQSWRID